MLIGYLFDFIPRSNFRVVTSTKSAELSTVPKLLFAPLAIGEKAIEEAERKFDFKPPYDPLVMDSEVLVLLDLHIFMRNFSFFFFRCQG